MRKYTHESALLNKHVGHEVEILLQCDDEPLVGILEKYDPTSIYAHHGLYHIRNLQFKKSHVKTIKPIL